MADITKVGETFVVGSVVDGYIAKADAGLAQIEADRAVLDGSPTNAQVIEILDRTLNRQAEIIKLWRKVLRLPVFKRR